MLSYQHDEFKSSASTNWELPTVISERPGNIDLLSERDVRNFGNKEREKETWSI